MLAWVEERIAAVTLLPRENGEAFNVLRVRHVPFDCGIQECFNLGSGDVEV